MEDVVRILFVVDLGKSYHFERTWEGLLMACSYYSEGSDVGHSYHFDWGRG